MIAVDSSALIAILRHETDAAYLSSRLHAGRRRLICLPAILECHISLARFGDPTLLADLDQSLVDLSIEPSSYEARHLAEARLAFDRYGKGRGHPAQLNFGDCLVYGFAKAEGLKLLFKGGDFAQTDIEPA